MDNNLKQAILQELESIKFGKIEIVLNEKAEYVDLITERTKRFYKKVDKKFEIENVKHEG